MRRAALGLLVALLLGCGSTPPPEPDRVSFDARRLAFHLGVWTERLADACRAKTVERLTCREGMDLLTAAQLELEKPPAARSDDTFDRILVLLMKLVGAGLDLAL